MTGTFKLAIELGNAEMQTGEDIAAALTGVVYRLAEQGETDGAIFDHNGNRVGQYAVVEDK